MKNVKKTILTLGMAGVLSILPRIGAKSDNVEGEVFIYDRSDSFGTTIGSLNIYSDCIRLLKGEQYSLIQYQNHLGFILNQDISKIHCMDHLEEFMGVHFIGVTKTKVNMRVDANTSTFIIETLDKGEEVSVLSILDNGWYLVSYHNTLGFIFSEYLNTFDYNEVLNEVRDMPTIQYHLKAKKDTKLFDSLGNYISSISKGEEVSFIRKVHENWDYVSYHDTFGYVKKNDFKKKIVIDSTPSFVVSLKNDSFLSPLPFIENGEVLPKYESCFVYGETTYHYLIESEGRVGYILKKDCEKLKGNYVIVDISSQKLVQFHDTTPVLISDVVTGKDSTPTDLGLYSIHTMEKERVLNGDDYSVLVHYWMGFHKEAGEGLHDIKRSHFGGEIYHKKGSHGCVNMPLKKARELYQNVSLGDKVLIKR